MSFPSLRLFTTARRRSLGRSGGSLPTSELLQLQLAHARAKLAVDSELDTALLQTELNSIGYDVLCCQSAVPDRTTYLRRPDLGRRLNENSRELLANNQGNFDVVFAAIDGLSALAVQRHASNLITAVAKFLETGKWNIAPIVLVRNGRVAIGDEIGDLLRAALCVVLIGERPGLSSSDSLGIYLTWNPKPGLTDVSRNCISNIRSEGLSYQDAARRLAILMNESRRRELSGVQLKEDSAAITGPDSFLEFDS